LALDLEEDTLHQNNQLQGFGKFACPWDAKGEKEICGMLSTTKKP